MKKDLMLKKGEVIPKGCQYHTLERKYNEGDRMPNACKNDKFITPDYTYSLHLKDEFIDYDGWSVVVNDKSKIEYEPILESINDVPITYLNNTFFKCKNMKKSPEIPKYVDEMSRAYYECESLDEAPLIPERVYYLTYAFAYCKNLKVAPKLPDSAYDISYMFIGCANLIKAPEITSEVTYLEYAFLYCDKLVAFPHVKTEQATKIINHMDIDDLDFQFIRNHAEAKKGLPTLMKLNIAVAEKDIQEIIRIINSEDLNTDNCEPESFYCGQYGIYTYNSLFFGDGDIKDTRIDTGELTPEESLSEALNCLLEQDAYELVNDNVFSEAIKGYTKNNDLNCKRIINAFLLSETFLETACDEDEYYTDDSYFDDIWRENKESTIPTTLEGRECMRLFYEAGLYHQEKYDEILKQICNK